MSKRSRVLSRIKNQHGNACQYVVEAQTTTFMSDAKSEVYSLLTLISKDTVLEPEERQELEELANTAFFHIGAGGGSDINKRVRESLYWLDQIELTVDKMIADNAQSKRGWKLF